MISSMHARMLNVELLQEYTVSYCDLQKLEIERYVLPSLALGGRRCKIVTPDS
jgi:hypothetical protein